MATVEEITEKQFKELKRLATLSGRAKHTANNPIPVDDYSTTYSIARPMLKKSRDDSLEFRFRMWARVAHPNRITRIKEHLQVSASNGVVNLGIHDDTHVPVIRFTSRVLPDVAGLEDFLGQSAVLVGYTPPSVQGPKHIASIVVPPSKMHAGKMVKFIGGINAPVIAEAHVITPEEIHEALEQKAKKYAIFYSAVQVHQNYQGDIKEVAKAFGLGIANIYRINNLVPGYLNKDDLRFKDLVALAVDYVAGMGKPRYLEKKLNILISYLDNISAFEKKMRKPAEPIEKPKSSYKPRVQREKPPVHPVAEVTVPKTAPVQRAEPALPRPSLPLVFPYSPKRQTDFCRYLLSGDIEEGALIYYAPYEGKQGEVGSFTGDIVLNDSNEIEKIGVDLPSLGLVMLVVNQAIHKSWNNDGIVPEEILRKYSS